MRIFIGAPHSQFWDCVHARLKGRAYALEACRNPADSRFRLERETYDLVLLDVEWPQGVPLLERLRKLDERVPILAAHARAQPAAARVLLLDLGADDCIDKSTHLDEVEARVRALLRRNGRKSPLVTCGQLVFDSNSRLFSIAGQPILLPQKEHALLQALIARPGCTFSKEELANTLYTIDDSASLHAVSLYVHRLRRRLAGAAASIENHRGVGYSLREGKQEGDAPDRVFDSSPEVSIP